MGLVGSVVVLFALGVVGAGLEWAVYRLTLVAAVSWGVEVRASVDLPTSSSDEQGTAKVVSQCLEFGLPIPDQFWGPKTRDLRGIGCLSARSEYLRVARAAEPGGLGAPASVNQCSRPVSFP